MKKITFELGEWEEAKIEGTNYKCPNCGAVMVIIPVEAHPFKTAFYAYCPNCGKYWLQKRDWNDELMDGSKYVYKDEENSNWEVKDD